MLKRIAGLLVVVLGVVVVPAAISQMEPTPRVYTFVSQFQVPRANWAQYSEDTEKTIVPFAEKMLADASSAAWSTFAQVEDTPEGCRRGAAWSANAIAWLMKVFDEVRE